MKLQQVLAMQAVTKQVQCVSEIAPVPIGDGGSAATHRGLRSLPARASVAAKGPLDQAQVANLLNQPSRWGDNVPGLYEPSLRPGSAESSVTEVLIQVDGARNRSPEGLVARLRVQQQVLGPAGAEPVNEDVDLVPEAGVSQIVELQSAHEESLLSKPIS